MTPLPIAEPLPESLDAEQCWLRLCDLPHTLFLDSAVVDGERGRYSFVAADPFAYHELPTGHPEIHSRLERLTREWTAATLPDLPPFQGGVAGVFAYELGQSIERVPAPRYDEFAFPAFAVGLYDVVLAFDHVRRRGWLVSQGFPATTAQERVDRARQRAAQFQRWLDRSPVETVRTAVGKRASARGQADPSCRISGQPLTSNPRRIECRGESDCGAESFPDAMALGFQPASPPRESRIGWAATFPATVTWTPCEGRSNTFTRATSSR